MQPIVLGALAMASAVAGLFFLRFWRETRDRLFAMFALAFWVLGVNWLGLALARRPRRGPSSTSSACSPSC